MWPVPEHPDPLRQAADEEPWRGGGTQGWHTAQVQWWLAACTSHSSIPRGTGHTGPRPKAHSAYPPGHEGVSLLQRGGVQLKERGDVVAVGHGHKAVLDLLPSIAATRAALHTLG